MAGTGPAPKAPEERRNRSAPQRGEWVDVRPFEPGEQRILPRLSALPEPPKREVPRNGRLVKVRTKWSARTRQAWNAWRDDPVSREYTENDVQAAIDLVFVYEAWVREPTVALAAEIRQRQDRLGMNPKGKRDLRLRRAQSAGELVQIRSNGGSKARAGGDRRARLSVVK